MAARDNGVDCWEDWRSRNTVRGAARTWPQHGPWCSAAAPVPDAECSREPGHPGRHMAGAARGIVAAWPGRDAPCAADLGEQPPADRFRQGRRNGELIYRQAGPGPSGADELVVVVPRDPDLAERIVGLLNREVSGA